MKDHTLLKNRDDDHLEPLTNVRRERTPVETYSHHQTEPSYPSHPTGVSRPPQGLQNNQQVNNSPDYINNNLYGENTPTRSPPRQPQYENEQPVRNHSHQPYSYGHQESVY